MTGARKPSENWYEAPAHAGDRPNTPKAEFDLLWRWERLRFWFNAILTFETVFMILTSRPLARTQTPLPILLVECCIAANLCFCAGPVANAYAQWLGLRHRAVTFLLFFAGTVLAVMLAAAVLVAPGFAGV